MDNGIIIIGSIQKNYCDYSLLANLNISKRIGSVYNGNCITIYGAKQSEIGPARWAYGTLHITTS